MLGYNITEQKEVVRAILKKYGVDHTDWDELSSAVVFKGVDKVAFKIPGTGGALTLTKPKRGNHKYPFLTLAFTRLLAVRGSTPLCKELAELMIVMHDLLADKVEELHPVEYKQLKGIGQTHTRWQANRNESRAMAKETNDLLLRTGGPRLAMEMNQFLNHMIVGTSSSDARRDILGMRKGETVRNVAGRGMLSEIRSVQDAFIIWLEYEEEDQRVPTHDECMAKLVECANLRQGAIAIAKGRPLLAHPGSVIGLNGSINPAGYKRAATALIANSAMPTHLLAETAQAKNKRQRIEDAKKPNPFLRYGFKVK